MQESSDVTPQTPIRANRVPLPNRVGSSGISITSPAATAAATDDTSETRLQQQLLRMQQQINNLTSSLVSQQNQNVALAPQQHLSREYWAMPIDKSIKYPGEDASQNAKTAYLQRLDSYISKSAPIWELVSGTSKCPIAHDVAAMAALKLKFGVLWQFEPKHISRSLKVLQRDHADVYDRVSARMNEGSDTNLGSWNQRNAALYSVVCDTLDLSKNGNDLEFLEVVDESNGLAMYNLLRFRLREIKSSDPLARAIKLQMGLEHIKYIPKPHGVAKYFARIEAHRSELASLPKPKIIDDWEVTAKALRELPQLHPQFKSTADILQIQRQLLKTETTLEECRKAFISAEIDNNIGGDLHSKNAPGHKGKRKLKTNLSQFDKKPRGANSPSKRKSGKYKPGDCIHHPNLTTHLTRECNNPFGIRSAFGLAVSYTDKCAAVKASVAAGWSPRATNVRIPQGYGCDTPRTNKNYPPPPTPTQTTNPPKPLHTNVSAIHNPTHVIRPDELHTYHKVRSIMQQSPTTAYQQNHHSLHRTPTLPHTMYPKAPRPFYGPPLRAQQVFTTYNPGHQVLHTHTIPTHHQHQFQPTNIPPPRHPMPTHMPAPIQANGVSFNRDNFPQPTQDDLIAAGMRYFATQSGMQDFP